MLSAIALSTHKITLGPAVENSFTIHPAVIVSLIVTLNRISNGKAALGIATGDATTLRGIGILQENGLEAVNEAIRIIRNLLKGGKTSGKGVVFYCADVKLKFEPNQDVPIYIGARGPKMLKIAGKIADGVLIGLSNPLDIRQSIQYIRR